MKALKNAWAQIVCILVIVLSAAWAGMTVFQSGIDDTPEQVKYRNSLNEVLAVENNQNDPRAGSALAVVGPMLPAIPVTASPTSGSILSRSFFPSGVPNPWTKTVAPQVVGGGEPPPPPEKAVDENLPAYAKPGILEVFQLNTGNYLVVVLPWERSMMAVTGFVVQRMEMHRTIDGVWKSKTGQWVNLPKYMVQDEAAAGQPLAPEGAPTVPAGTAPAPAPARSGLLGPGPAPKVTGAGGGLLGTTPTGGSGFDLKKYQGIYVLFDRMELKPDHRFDYRLAIIAKPFTDAVDKTITANGKITNVKITHPEELSVPYGNLRIFAPGPVVQPTTTGKVQVKFVSAIEDKSEASFIVMRGQASSKIVNIKAGEEIFAELPVLDEKGRPVVDEGGNKKEDVHTNFTYTTVDIDAETKKPSAVLTGADKQEVLIEQGKTNGDPNAPEVDISLLYKLQTEREKEYKTLFKTTADKGDTAYTVPAKDFDTAAAGILDSLKPNDFYPTPDDDTTPPSPLPQLTLAPLPKPEIRKIPVIHPVQAQPNNVRPPVVQPPPTRTMPPDMGGRPMGGPGDRDRTFEQPDERIERIPEGVTPPPNR